MERLNPKSRRDRFGRKINRAQSPVLVHGIPWLTIMAGSLTPLLPVLPPAPLIPPLAYLMLLAWRLLRPGVLPLWAGLPLGLFDDLFSGQMMGSAVLLFSLTLITIDLIEVRFPWRGFWQDWLVASVLSTAYLVLSVPLSGAGFSLAKLSLLWPQAVLAIVIYPLVARLAGLADLLRLLRVREVG